MKSIISKNALKGAGTLLLLFLGWTPQKTSAQLTTANFVEEANCDAIDLNTFVLASGFYQVGAARYNSSIPLTYHIYLDAMIRLTGISSAGIVVGQVASVPYSAFLSPTGGWPTSTDRIILKLSLGAVIGNLSLAVDGTNVWSTPISLELLANCQKIGLQLSPGEFETPSHIRVFLNDVQQMEYEMDYKDAVFGGAYSTQIRLWGVSSVGTTVQAALNNVCPSAMRTSQPEPPRQVRKWTFLAGGLTALGAFVLHTAQKKPKAATIDH